MQYPDIEKLPDNLKEIIERMGNTNVYKMLMHTPNVAPGFTEMANAVMWSKTWPATWREMAIVRVGHLYDAPYEIHHHTRIGRMVGLTDSQLDACFIGADQSSLTHEERTILRLTDALVSNHRLTQAERDEASKLMDANALADFVLTVGFYQLAANFLNVFDVQVEEKGGQE